ncbi:MAG: hypothetical protein HC824_02775 [Synechococcales cyanobacterium RM1_1_8]|nr:hypothetical protein [Synechococcales cyanobacterium RM1_1_8]
MPCPPTAISQGNRETLKGAPQASAAIAQAKIQAIISGMFLPSAESTGGFKRGCSGRSP